MKECVMFVATNWDVLALIFTNVVALFLPPIKVVKKNGNA